MLTWRPRLRAGIRPAPPAAAAAVAVDVHILIQQVVELLLLPCAIGASHIGLPPPRGAVMQLQRWPPPAASAQVAAGAAAARRVPRQLLLLLGPVALLALAADDGVDRADVCRIADIRKVLEPALVILRAAQLHTIIVAAAAAASAFVVGGGFTVTSACCHWL